LETPFAKNKIKKEADENKTWNRNQTRGDFAWWKH